MKQEVCVLGAGRMSSSIVSSLLNNGYATSVWNRTTAKCEPLITAGAKSSVNLEDVVRRPHVIVVNVLDFSASDTLLKGNSVASLLSGKIVVQLTSGSPKLAREEAVWVETQGAEYLDGAIMATPDFIGRPEAALLYSGSKSAYETCEPVLLTLGGRHDISAIGQGKLPPWTPHCSHRCGEVFSGPCKAWPSRRRKVLKSKSFGISFSPSSPSLIRRSSTWSIGQRAADSPATRTLASLGAHYSAFQHLFATCEELELNASLPQMMDRFFRRALAQNDPDADFASLVPMFRRDGMIADVVGKANA